jgi:hypothetical protein
MLRALGYQLILYSEFSQIDLTLTTIYHSLFWGRDIPVPFIGDRRTKGVPWGDRLMPPPHSWWPNSTSASTRRVEAPRHE